MRVRISLLVTILCSVPLLELYHHADALGIDSTSHGLLYGGRVVRRYGFESDLFDKRYSRGLQERADPPKVNDPPKGNDPEEPKAKAKAKEEPKAKAKEKDDPKQKPKGITDNPKTKGPVTPEISEEPVKEKEPAKETPAKAPPKTPAKAKDPSVDPTDTDPTAANQANQQDGGPPPLDGGTPKVPTGTMSSSAVAGLVSIGGVFVLVAGLFAFSKRRKNKEMTKNIMTTSAKAWEHQNSTYEKTEEEATPIGSYTVIATYTPTLGDELDIQPGDKVTILVEFDDGWVQGINETRGGTKGVFPRHCVDMDRISPSITNNKRSSSIGGYGERYTEVDLN